VNADVAAAVIQLYGALGLLATLLLVSPVVGDVEQ
jgi:hypothetical protein